jgi:hypothetical protein
MFRADPTLARVDALSAAQPSVVTYYSDTSIANLRALTAAATFTQLFGPFTFSSVPDSIHIFWPFTLSKLRLHSFLLEKYA